MSTAIVVLNVSRTTAPAPDTLQKTGAFISQGATTLADGVKELLTTPATLSGFLRGALALSALSWASNLVTATAAAPHGITVGQAVELTVVGVTPSGYNGTYLCTATDATHFTYPLNSNPGSETVPGSYTPEDVSELVAMNNTFWANGSQQPVYVLELGLGSTAEGVTALDTYIDDNTVDGTPPFYSYLFPRLWAGEATLPAFLAQFEDEDAKTYFFITATAGNHTNFTAAMKCAFVMIEAAGVGVAELSCAAPFHVTLNYAPSATNKITPTCFTNLFGVTPFPRPGNQTIIENYLSGGNNLVLSGAEGGLSSTLLRNGTTKDLRDFSYWYAVDWVQTNVNRNVSAAVINGSNNPQNPLDYNQDGIDRLQAVILSTMAQGVTFGMVLGVPLQVKMSPADFEAAVAAGKFAGQTPVNAQQFIPYSVANPNDFAAGVYSGFQIAMTPSRGFKQIIIGLNVTDFVTN